MDIKGAAGSSSSSLSSNTVAKEEEETLQQSPTQQQHDGYQPTYKVNTTNYILPGIHIHDAQPLSAVSAGRAYTPITNHFQTKTTLDPSSTYYAKTWGKWNFIDPNPKYDGTIRPQPINYNNVSNRDVQNVDFPEGAWQCDTNYMSAFLQQAKQLINRTIEAIYAEYGVGIIPSNNNDDDANNNRERALLSEEMFWSGRESFAPFILRDTMAVPLPPTGLYSYSTRQSFDGIARRFIHHIMTGDTFKLVLGGHSAGKEVEFVHLFFFISFEQYILACSLLKTCYLLFSLSLSLSPKCYAFIYLSNSGRTWCRIQPVIHYRGGTCTRTNLCASRCRIPCIQLCSGWYGYFPTKYGRDGSTW